VRDNVLEEHISAIFRMKAVKISQKTAFFDPAYVFSMGKVVGDRRSNSQ
jgi:hypothetical protein